MNKFFAIFAIAFIFGSISVRGQKKEGVELPMGRRGLMPTIEVMVNGQGPFTFAIDTGAQGEARLDSSLVEKLGLKPTGSIRASDGSGGNTRTLETMTVDSIEFGGLKFKNLTALTRNYNVSPNLPKIDGILGFNLFADYLLTLDFPAQKVRVDAGQLPVANGRDILDFDGSNGLASVELSVGDQKVKAHIDSGNLAGGFMLPTAVVEKSNLAGEAVVVGRARTVTSEIEIKQAQLKDTIRLGQFSFDQPTINFPALADANIGARVLNEFALTFDQKNRRLRLKRTETKKTDPPAATDVTKFKDLVGVYGQRTIFEENGSLFIQRTGGPKLKLKELSENEYALEQVPNARIKFVRDGGGKVTAIEVLNPQGVWEKSAKN
ncbi:MAG: retropepsin-like aspartic protease [Pyrinomonadaceae bacterium]